MRSWLAISFLALFFVIQVHAQSPLALTVVTDEADAVLAILDERTKAIEPTSDEWNRLFRAEGYQRLKKREASLGRTFEDDEFRKFVLSTDLLAHREILRITLEKWLLIDPTAAGQKALKYLPANAAIKAKIYPVIKPRDNSFVFEVRTDPAIFLYLDPVVTPQKFENTLAHELHHIGFGTACPPSAAKIAAERLPERVHNVLGWIGDFGEGFAMIAAAGGPDVHPHAVSDVKDRERWDKDVGNFNADVKKVEAFLFDVASGKLSGEEMNKAGFEFFGVQGPWYTVGWKMAVVIEKTYGRKKLIESFCDQRLLLATYDRAVKKYNKKSKEELIGWSPELLKAL
jgi:hypothetical protein